MDFGTERRDRPIAVQLSTSHMIRLRDEKRPIAFTLTNGQVLQGRIVWFDDHAYHVAVESGEITLLRGSVLYYAVAG